eukprot:5552594-Alexandrium_andersonii.AAC.1
MAARSRGLNWRTSPRRPSLATARGRRCSPASRRGSDSRRRCPRCTSSIGTLQSASRSSRIWSASAQDRRA